MALGSRSLRRFLGPSELRRYALGASAALALSLLLFAFGRDALEGFLFFVMGASTGGLLSYALASGRRRRGLPLRGGLRLGGAAWSGPPLVCVGGGTGLSSLLRGLKQFTPHITAVVTVTDEGGSSGRLREELGILPPGDIRNCLVALADDEGLMSSVLQHRFRRGELAGHSLGNLLLLALQEIKGDLRQAVEYASRILATRGRVLPVTLENVTLEAELEDGTSLRGEMAISRPGKARIRRIWLSPPEPSLSSGIKEALRSAEMVILGPGSLFTSVIPNLLVPEMRRLLRSIPVPLVYVCNVMTQPGETDGFSCLDHVEWISTLLGRYPDWVVVNEGELPEEVLSRYAAEGAFPVVASPQEVEVMRAKGARVKRVNLVSVLEGGVVRHHPLKTAEVVMEIWRSQGL